LRPPRRVWCHRFRPPARAGRSAGKEQKQGLPLRCHKSGPHCKADTQPASHLQKQKSQVAFLLRVLFRPTRPPSPVVPSASLRCAPPKAGGSHSAPYRRAPQLGSGPRRPRTPPLLRRFVVPPCVPCSLRSPVSALRPGLKTKANGPGSPNCKTSFTGNCNGKGMGAPSARTVAHVARRTHQGFAPSLQLVRLCTWLLCWLQCPLARASGQRQPPTTTPTAKAKSAGDGRKSKPSQCHRSGRSGDHVLSLALGVL